MKLKLEEVNKKEILFIKTNLNSGHKADDEIKGVDSYNEGLL